MLKKIGILREEKQPVDKRTPIIPSDCKKLIEKFNDLQIYIQPSTDRCFTDEEFRDAGVIVQENILDCNLLLGVKEVPIHYLIPHRKYMFFSHTIKKQANNLKLLQSFLDMQIEFIDYEALVDENNIRVVAFGYWAGVVGAYNAIWMSQKRNHKLELPRLYQSKDYNSVKNELKNINQSPIKYLVTGTGRVASGVIDVMNDAGITRVTKDEFLTTSFDYPVYTQLTSADLYAPKFKHITYTREEFHERPLNFKSCIEPFLFVSDVLINAIYWDIRAPKFFALKDMKRSDFKIKSIADITCDIAPDSSIPSTLKATTILQPVFGFLPLREKMVDPYSKNAIDVMSIANLPSELPRDSSTSFSNDLTSKVIPEFFLENSEMITKATVTKKGNLTSVFSYLESFVYDDVYRASKIK